MLQTSIAEPKYPINDWVIRAPHNKIEHFKSIIAIFVFSSLFKRHIEREKHWPKRSVKLTKWHFVMVKSSP